MLGHKPRLFVTCPLLSEHPSIFFPPNFKDLLVTEGFTVSSPSTTPPGANIHIFLIRILFVKGYYQVYLRKKKRQKERKKTSNYFGIFLSLRMGYCTRGDMFLLCCCVFFFLAFLSFPKSHSSKCKICKTILVLSMYNCLFCFFSSEYIGTLIRPGHTRHV